MAKSEFTHVGSCQCSGEQHTIWVNRKGQLALDSAHGRGSWRRARVLSALSDEPIHCVRVIELTRGHLFSFTGAYDSSFRNKCRAKRKERQDRADEGVDWMQAPGGVRGRLEAHIAISAGEDLQRAFGQEALVACTVADEAWFSNVCLPDRKTTALAVTVKASWLHLRRRGLAVVDCHYGRAFVIDADFPKDGTKLRGIVKVPDGFEEVRLDMSDGKKAKVIICRPLSNWQLPGTGPSTTAPTWQPPSGHCRR